jgi:hypothetical protein
MTGKSVEEANSLGGFSSARRVAQHSCLLVSRHEDGKKFFNSVELIFI